MTRRRFLLLAATLVALNTFFWLAQGGFALPGGADRPLLRPAHDPRRGDRRRPARRSTISGSTAGVITATAPGSITIRERDGTVVTISVTAATKVIAGRRASGTSRSSARRCASSSSARRTRRRRRSRSKGDSRADVMTGAGATGSVLLLVEDDESIGRLVKQYLEQQDGWRVLWLRTGEEAVGELRRHPVRLVVLDVGLPGIDGFEVCRQMRAWSKVPIVMLTARDEEPDRVAGLRARRRRLRPEAVLAPRAGRADQGDPPPRGAAPRGRGARRAARSSCAATRTR